MDFISGGLYVLKDKYFLDYPDPFLKSNKNEHRPFYYCFTDKRTGLFWMIPLSSSAPKVELAKSKIAQGKKDIFHLTNVGGKDGVMLIADMCPVTSEYILNSYDILGVPVVFKDKKELREINSKATKVLALLRRGVKFSKTQPDVFSIEASLLENKSAV